MSIRANRKFIDDVKADDNMYYETLIIELESLLDAEILKNEDEINEIFIDECCKTIEYLRSVQTGIENGDYEVVFDINALIRAHHRKARMIYIGSVACTVVAVLCAVFSMRTDSTNEQSLLRPYSPGENSCKQSETKSDNITEESVNTTLPHISESDTIVEPVDTSGQIVTDNVIPPVTQPIPHIYRLDVILAPGNILTFEDISEINLNNAFVKVSYSDNHEEMVPIEECQVDIGEADEDGNVRVTVTYKHMYTDIYVKVQATE